MGITGTDVAKESSEMILLDDNFASIVNAVEEGRGIYENIRRFIVFLLCCNAGEVATMFVASLLFFRPEFLPFLLPIQILWMNLVTDGLPAIALGLEPTAKDVMDRPPIDPKEPPLNRRSVYKVLTFALVIATVTLLAFQTELGWLISNGSPEGPAIDRARTVAFATIVMFQLLFAFVSRSDTQSLRSLGLLSNRKLLLAVGASFLLQLLVIYVPMLNRPFGTVALGWEDWIVVLGFAGTAVVANALWKFYWQQADKAKRPI
jgi:Ca2+-transporting ATPase